MIKAKLYFDIYRKRTFDDEDLSETQKKKTTKQFKMQLKNFDAW